MTLEEQKLSEAQQRNWQRYQALLQNPNLPHWDEVILTASNEQQARGFQAQIAQRRAAGVLPELTSFGVVPDPVGQRVGNGGAMLGALQYVLRKHGRCSDLKVLVILSSGDSKRVPQYSALGKVFSPVPRELPDHRSSALFDEIMLGMVGIPEKMKDGMLVLSGDVMLAFDDTGFPALGDQAAAISFPEPVATGAGHGVFLMDEQGDIKNVWHKQKPEALRSHGAVEADGCVQIDTGAVYFPPRLLERFSSFIRDENGRLTDAAFSRFVNGRVAPSLYVDFFYPFVKDATFDGYMKEVPECAPCAELMEMRRHLWTLFSEESMRLIALRPSRFIHFGSTQDVMHLMAKGIGEYSFLDWQRHVGSGAMPEGIAAYNAWKDEASQCGKRVYLEECTVQNSRIGDDCILSCVALEGVDVPQEVVLHGTRLTNGRYVVRAYGTRDSMKAELEQGATIFGCPMAEWMEKSGIRLEEMWDEDTPHLFWTARLYKTCASMNEAVKAALRLHEAVLQGRVENAWREGPRESLNSSFVDADGVYIANRQMNSRCDEKKK